MSFLCVIRIELHLPEGSSLKGKRKQLLSLKAQIKRRFGATISETAHHELWQRATLSAALVGRDAGSVGAEADRLERFVDAHFPDGARVERALVSTDEILDGRLA